VSDGVSPSPKGPLNAPLVGDSIVTAQSALLQYKRTGGPK